MQDLPNDSCQRGHPDPAHRTPQAFTDADRDEARRYGIECTLTSDSLALTIPRSGFRGAAGNLLVFSLVWDGLVLAILTAAFFAKAKHSAGPANTDYSFMIIFAGVCGIAVGAPLITIQLAYRRAVILATREALVFTLKGPLRSAEYQWKPADISIIRVDYSEFFISTAASRRAMGYPYDPRNAKFQQLSELRIHTHSATKRRFLVGRDRPELNVLAKCLCKFYGL
jgi:hypothetical protein